MSTLSKEQAQQRVKSLFHDWYLVRFIVRVCLAKKAQSGAIKLFVLAKVRVLPEKRQENTTKNSKKYNFPVRKITR